MNINIKYNLQITLIISLTIHYQMSQSFAQLVTSSSPKIICVGKNYLKHVKEMGGSEVPSQPMLFTKPWTSIAYNPKELKLSIAEKHRIDHELQLGVYLKKGGSNIEKEEAMGCVGGYFLALDLTDRDFQKIAKQKGFPWTLSKGQDNFCPISPLFPSVPNPYSIQLHLSVNGQTRQKDLTSNMHFKINDLISYASQYITLSQGDLFLTGTPEGVGPIKIGDQIHGTASLDGQVLGELKFGVVG